MFLLQAAERISAWPRRRFQRPRPRRLHCLRQGRWKLNVRRNINWSETEDVEELYDLSKDPGEKVNLIDSEKDLADIFRKEVEKYFRLDGEGNPGSIVPDEETIRRLKALGYL